MQVVDASVIAKVFVTETGSAEALQVLGRDRDLLVPAHCFAEVAETLVRKRRLRQIAAATIDQLTPALMDLFTTVPLEPLLPEAMRLSERTGASVYDCLYVALAIAEDCQLVTADLRLNARLAGTQHASLLTALLPVTSP